MALLFKSYRFKIFIFGTAVQIFVLILVSRYMYNAIYGTNDDLYMASVLQGNLTETDRLNVFYVGPIFSAIIVSLSKLNESISWYSVSLLAFAILTFSYLLSTMLRKEFKNIFKIYLFIFWIIITFSSIAYNYLQPTFTSISIIISGVGVIAYFIRRITLNNKKNTWNVLPLLIIGLAISLRWESFILVIFMIFVILLLLSTLRELKLQDFLFSVYPIAAVIVFVRFFETYLYRWSLTEEWLSNYELVSVVDLYHPSDNRYLATSNWNLSSLSFTENINFEMFKNFILYDEALYSSDYLISINKSVDASLFDALSYFISNFSLQSYVRQIFQQYSYLFAAVSIIILIFLLFINNFNKLLLGISYIIILACYVVLLNFLYISYKLPERVYFSIFILVFLHLLFVHTLIISNKNIVLSHNITISALVILALALFLRDSKSEYLARNAYYGELKNKASLYYKIYDEMDSSGIVIGNISSLNINYINPYNKKLLTKRLSDIIPLGWFNTSPHWRQHIMDQGLDPEELTLALINKKMYFVVENNLVDLLHTYLQTETNLQIGIEKYYLDESTALIKFTAL